MKKQKVYDSSLVNAIRGRKALYDTYIAPENRVIEEYQHSMENPVELFKPDSYGFGDHITNAFYDWNYSKNETDKDTELGDYVRLDEDYNTLLGLKEYINATRGILDTSQQLSQDPNNEELRDQLRELAQISTENKPAYEKAISGRFNTGYLNDDITTKLKKGKLDSVLNDVEFQTNVYLKPNQTEPAEWGGKGNLYNQRYLALKNAKKYEDKAQYYKGKMTNAFYNAKKEQPGMDLLDIDTYLYKSAGLLGSSSASLGRQILGTGSAIFASTAIGGPIGTGLAILGSIAANLSSRDRESKAEVYQNYKTAIQNAADKAGISKDVLKDAKAQMAASGKYTKAQIDDDNFVYDQILSDNVKVNNVKFDRIRLNKLDGLQSLYTDNMALSGSDLLQQALEVVPLGKIAKAAKGLSALQKLSRTGAGKLIGKATEGLSGIGGKLANRIDDVTAFGLDNISKLPTRRVKRAVADLGGRLLVTAALEGAEEGVQYIKGKKYTEGDFDSNPNLAKSWLKNLGTGARAIFAAVTPWDPVYSDDQEFLENFKGGALLGGLMTGAIGTATTAVSTNRQLSADKFVSSLFAENMDLKDRVQKNVMYGKKLREGKWNNVQESFDYLESLNVEGVSQADVQAERQRAETFRNMFTSQNNMRQAAAVGIDPRTEDYDVFVALKDHHDQMYTEATKRAGEYSSEVEQIMYSPEVEQHIQQIAPNATPDEQAQIRKAIELKSFLQQQSSIIDDYFSDSGKKLDEIQKNTGLRTSKTDVITFKHMLNKDKKSVQKAMNELSQAVQKLGITEDQLEVPKVHQTLKDTQEKQIFAELDKNRAEVEREIMFSTDKEAIETKIKKYKDVDTKSDEFIQRLDDLYSGKTEEKAVEEGKVVAPEILTEPAPIQTTQETPTVTEQEVYNDFISSGEWGLQQRYDARNKGRAEEVARIAQEGRTEYEAQQQAQQALTQTQQVEQPTPTVTETVTPQPVAQESPAQTTTVTTQTETEPIKETKQATKEQKIETPAEVTKQEVEAQTVKEEIQKNEREQTLIEQKKTPTQDSDVVQIAPMPDPNKTEPARVEDIPTLGSILSGLVGDEATGQLDQATEAEAVIEQQNVPEIQESLEAQQLGALSYDPLEDPYSHELNYRMTEAYQDESNMWRRRPIKFRQMEDYLNNDDFKKISTGIEFVKKAEGNTRFEVKDYKDPETGKVEQDIYAIFTIDGKEYVAAVKRVEGLYARSNTGFLRKNQKEKNLIVSNLQALRNKIIELDKEVQRNPKLQIVPTRLKSTTGVVVNLKNEDGSPKNRLLTDTVWQEVKDPYKITPQNTEVGVTTGGNGGNVIRLGSRVLSAKGFPMGKPAWVVKVQRQDGGVDEKVVILNYKKFNELPGVAETILDLLTSNQPFYTDKNGVQTQIKPIELLSFIVNFGPHTATDPNSPKLTPDQVRARMAKQFYIDENNNVIIGPTTYTMNDLLTNEAARKSAIDYIKDNFHYAIDEAGLTSYYLGGNLQSKVRDPRFTSVQSFLKNSNVDNLVIVPGELEFGLKDFGLKKDEQGRKFEDPDNINGISVLGWYIKQGILVTDIADNLNDCNIYVDDVMLIDTTAEKVVEQAQEDIKEAVKEHDVITLPDESGKDISIDLTDMFALLDGKKRKGPNMTVESVEDKDLAQNTVDKMDVEQAKSWLDSTLGIEPDIRSAVIDVTEAGLSVVGRVTDDSILLYNEAPRGTEYHEAWHRVSLLLIDDKRRNRIYDRYRKKGMSNKAIDEVLAEDFRSFMLDESGKYNFDTKNWFKRILNFIKLWIRTGQYGLARMYSDINRGKFYGIQPSKENVERFKRIYGDEGANLEVNGYKFKTISQYKQFDDIVKSLTYAFFQTNFADGKTIDYADLATNPPSFSTLKLIVEAQAYKFPSPVMTEIVEKFDDIYAPAIAIRLKNLGIRTIDNVDLADIEEGSERVNIGQHTVEGMNISIKDNAPAEVKFFFQTIPAYEIGKDGRPQTKFDDNTHFPRFVDSDVAWTNVLKDLAGCRTLSNILQKVVTNAKYDPFYQALLVKFNRLIQDSNKGDIMSEAMLTKLETVITSDINNYVTAKVSADKETGTVSMSLVDNTVDVKAINYPKVWSQSLFTNSGLFKYNSEGTVVAEDGATRGLQIVIDSLNRMRSAFSNNKGVLKVGEKNIDLHIPANQEDLKDNLVRMFNVVGILIDKPTINKMLMSGTYGNPQGDTYTLLNSFITSAASFGGIPRIVSTLEDIKSAINKDGSLKEIVVNNTVTKPTEIWNSLGFVKEMANYYAYVHATDSSLNSYGPDGNSYYMVSQNNFAKDRISELITDKELREQLYSVQYNKNSILLNAAMQGNTDIQVETLINFKDTTSYDTGRDYFGITDREDYLAKMTAVFNNRLIFPTVADKKTYHLIKGINLPHERINFIPAGNGKYVKYGSDSLNILLGYCQDELNQIELALRQTDDDPNHYDEKTGIHYNEDGSINEDWLKPSRRIKNFHTPNKYTYKDKDGIEHTVELEGNGCRFLFLTGIYTNDGFISFNDPAKSARENLQTAKDYFFNTSIETQQAFLGAVITQRVKNEIQTALDLGLIESATGNNEIWSLRNKLMDDNVLAERKGFYNTVDANNAEGYAIFDMLADYTINSIISISEIEKIFSGAPAYYKVKYDRTGITDISVDKIKRLGSLTSTGVNNRLDFFNDPMREDYVVAELKDHEIMSKQYYEYEGLFTRGNIKETIQELNGEEAWDKVKDLSIQEIEKIYPEEVQIARNAAKVEVAGYKKGINVADAAVYISPNMTRDLLRMRGVWSPEIKQAFEVLTNPETADKWESDPELYAKANKVILNAMKYVAFGTRLNEISGLGIPYFNKMALFPLFKSIATGDIKALYDRMTGEKPIDMVMFDSAVKAGSRNPMKAYRSAKDSEIELRDGQTVLSASVTDQLISGEGNTLNNLNNLTTYTQKFKYLRQQLETNPHTHEEQMAGTQFMKVNLSNLRMKDMYGKEGDQVSGKQIKDTVMNALNKLSDIGKQKLQAELFTEDGEVNITALGNMLEKDARESGANDNVISGVKTKNNAFTIPLSALSDNKWLESRFIAMINKQIIDVNMPGGAFIQRSAFGLEATSTNVITEDMINDGKPLLSINEKDGSMDSVVSINLFKHIIPNYKKMTFRQARQWLIDKGIIGQNAEATAIGYRIPTQSIASISALRFVDVFPEIMGDTIMLPEDFTKLTGSDFDIDKLYVARFGFNENGVKVLDDSEVGIKNSMLDAYMKVLLTKDNTNALKLSIDNATENVKDVLYDIESNRPVHHAEPMEVYTPSYQEARKAEYTGGKAGIGPFALNNAHHILTQLVGTKMEYTPFTAALDIVDLGRIYDYPTAGQKKGGRILDWLSAMINGFVDIAKDPYIVRLNVNGWTYNMVSFLLRTGKGKQTFYFMSQPILKEMAEEVLKTKGKYGIDRTKTPSQLEKEAINKVLVKYDPDGQLRKKYEYINNDEKLKAKEYENLFKTYIDEDGNEQSYTRDVLFMPPTIEVGEKTYESSEFKEQQVRMYYAWKALKPYADDLANLVKYSKIDTKKTGKSFAEQQTYYNGMWDMTVNSKFGDGEVRRFYEETFIGHKTENSIPFGTSIFKNLIFRNTDTFISQKDVLLSLLGRKANASSDLIKSVVNGMEAQLKSEFFNQYMKDNNIDFNSMFKGRNSMAKRLNRFKQEILKGNPKLSHLLSNDGTIANDFVNYLIPNINNDFLDFIDTSSLLGPDQAMADNLINYWRELIDDPQPQVSKLFKDLVVYAFLTSGDNSAMNSFFQFVPNSCRVQMGYTEFVQGKLEQMMNESTLGYYGKDDMILNNWTNDKLVKPVDMYGGPNSSALRGIYLNDQVAMPNIVLGQRNDSDFNVIGPISWVKITNPIDLKTKSYPLFPPYIKMRDNLGFGPENWHVYTLIGYKETLEVNSVGKPTGRINYSPVYGLVSKKGYKYRGHTIVEYNKSTDFDFNKEQEWDYQEALNNKSALVDQAFDIDKEQWAEDLANIHPIMELPSYSNMNYALAEQDRVFVEDQSYDFDEDPSVLEEVDNPNQVDTTSSQAETWSKKEGWSTEYFNEKVLPRIKQAWQIEFTLAPDQSVTPTLKGAMNYSYDNYKAPGIKSDTTLDAIKNGERTATTRYESDGNIEYWSKAKVGDVIQFTNKQGDSVKVVVTNHLTKLYTPEATQLDLFNSQPLTGIDLVQLYEEGNKRISELLEPLELTTEERQTYLNEFAQMMADDNVNTIDGLENVIRKFICNL